MTKICHHNLKSSPFCLSSGSWTTPGHRKDYHPKNTLHGHFSWILGIRLQQTTASFLPTCGQETMRGRHGCSARYHSPRSASATKQEVAEEPIDDFPRPLVMHASHHGADMEAISPIDLRRQTAQREGKEGVVNPLPLPQQADSAATDAMLRNPKKQKIGAGCSSFTPIKKPRT